MEPTHSKNLIPENPNGKKILIFSGGMCLFMILLIGATTYLLSQLYP